MDKKLTRQSENCKFVGLVIDEYMNWNTLVAFVIRKMSPGIFALRLM